VKQSAHFSRYLIDRGLLPTFLNWIDSNRVIDAWVEKINGTPGKPAVYIYVKISPMHLRTILGSELDDFETECRIAKLNPQEQPISSKLKRCF
jgi:hypothetical protein